MTPDNVIEKLKEGLTKFDELAVDDKALLIGSRLWAKQLIRGDNPSESKVSELTKYFTELDGRVPDDSFEQVEYLLHGGKAGEGWVKSLSEVVNTTTNQDANSTPTKRIVNWGDIKLAVQHERGDIRFAGGTPMKCAYGCVMGSYGKAEDGKGIDFYLADEPGDKLYVALQTELNATLPESKWLIGFKSLEDARDTLVRHVGEARLQGIREAELWELQKILDERQDYGEFVRSFSLYRSEMGEEPQEPPPKKEVFLCLKVPPSKLLPIPEIQGLEIVKREDDPHITLLYCGEVEMPEDRQIELERSIFSACASVPMIQGRLSGVGLFNGTESSDMADVVIALYDAPRLTELRYSLMEALKMCRIDPLQNHGYTPHCTLAYVKPEQSETAQVTLPRVPDIELNFERVFLYLGDEEFSYELGGAVAQDRADEALQPDGDVMEESEFDAIAEVTEEDTKSAVAKWKQTAPDEFRELIG